MILYRRELRANLKSLLIWSGGMAFLIIAGMGKYDAGTQGGSDTIEKILSGMPDTLQKFFGVGVFDLSRAVEYYGIMFIYISLMLSLSAVLIGTGIISKEERDKTADFLLVKPISRQRILWEKMLAALTHQGFLWLVTYGVSYAMLFRYSNGDEYSSELFSLMAAALGLQILFLSLGVFFSCVLRRSKIAAAVSSGVVLFMFTVKIISDIFETVQFMGFLSFFHYFDAKDLLVRGYSPGLLLIPGVLCVAFLFLSFSAYRRRDIVI